MRKTYLLSLILVLLASCSWFPTVFPPAPDSYAAASRAYDAESILYAQAGDAIDAAHDRMTAAQWTQFQDDQAAVRAADALVFADLDSWRNTGVKPTAYDGHAQALRAAQQKVRDLAAEVQR